jgi:hypothetical protein
VLLHMVGASLIDKKLTFGDVSAKNASKQEIREEKS